MLGAGLHFWEQLVQFVQEQYAPDEDFRFMYGKQYGWALRFQIRAKLLTSLYPTEGGVTARQIASTLNSVEMCGVRKIGMLQQVQHAVFNDSILLSLNVAQKGR
jgi:hypothetical protein